MYLSYRLVKIEWYDSRQPQPEWQFLEDFKPPDIVKCITVGYIINENKIQKSICQNIADYKKDIQVSGIITIPSCCILKITNLEESK
jgi:hypothetical protein